MATQNVNIISYGVMNGNVNPNTINLLLSLENLPNPYNIPELRTLDGTDAVVQRWLTTDERTTKVLFTAVNEAQAYMDERNPGVQHTIAFRCYGGQHRSVALAELLKTMLDRKQIPCTIQHRDLKGHS